MKKIINIIILILWMIMIFFFSSQGGKESGSLSTGIIEYTVKTYYGVTGADVTKEKLENAVTSFSKVIRKTAHFLEYLVLGLLILNVIKDYRIIGYKELMITLALCCLYASSDELHQIYVPGRSGEVKDVILDTFGSLTGIIIYKSFRKKTIRGS